MYPSYLNAFNKGKLKETAQELGSKLAKCAICPRKCGIDRTKSKAGFCKTGLKARVHSFLAHHGEEPPISGRNGSGAIFFSGCNMACVYCQNYEFSQGDEGREVGTKELSSIMLSLQKIGCHNINLVTPTHVLPQILEALLEAIPRGLNIPLVYNTSGFELPEIIAMLRGIVDVYLPDMRYASNAEAEKYSYAPGYPKYNQCSVKEMHRQVGLAELNEEGIIRKGLIIRHLVLPRNMAGTERIMKFIAEELSAETFISLMSQYSPYYNAGKFEEISRRLSSEEYAEAKLIMEHRGLGNGWIQEAGGLERFAGHNIKTAFEQKDDT